MMTAKLLLVFSLVWWWRVDAFLITERQGACPWQKPRTANFCCGVRLGASTSRSSTSGFRDGWQQFDDDVDDDEGVRSYHYRRGRRSQESNLVRYDDNNNNNNDDDDWQALEPGEYPSWYEGRNVDVWQDYISWDNDPAVDDYQGATEPRRRRSSFPHQQRQQPQLVTKQFPQRRPPRVQSNNNDRFLLEKEKGLYENGNLRYDYPPPRRNLNPQQQQLRQQQRGRGGEYPRRNHFQDQQERAIAAGLGTGVLGLLVGGPVGAALLGFSSAYAAENFEDDSIVGDSARAIGDVALAAKKKGFEINQKHQVVDRTIEAAQDTWQAAKDLDRKYQLVQKAKDVAVYGTSATMDFVQKHNLVNKGVQGVGKSIGWVSDKVAAGSLEGTGGDGRTRPMRNVSPFQPEQRLRPPPALLGSRRGSGGGQQNNPTSRWPSSTSPAAYDRFRRDPASSNFDRMPLEQNDVSNNPRRSGEDNSWDRRRRPLMGDDDDYYPWASRVREFRR